jgi:hypothetical protein
MDTAMVAHLVHADANGHWGRRRRFVQLGQANAVTSNLEKHSNGEEQGRG